MEMNGLLVQQKLRLIAFVFILFNIIFATLATDPHWNNGRCNGGSAASLNTRVESSLAGALVADYVARWTQGEDDIAQASKTVDSKFKSLLGNQLPWPPPVQTENGNELLQALEVVSSRGFEFNTFAVRWRAWAEAYSGNHGPGVNQVLRTLARGVSPESVGSHWIDLGGAVRVPALLLLANEVDDDGLALASHEIQVVSHENPKALQAGELFLRTTLLLLRLPEGRCGGDERDAKLKRREIMAKTLKDAALKAGPLYETVIDEAFAEVGSRDAVFRAVGQGSFDAGHLADFHTDAAVLGRLTASGENVGQEVQGPLTPWSMPAIIWFVLAYDSLLDAMRANAKLGGAAGTRAIFIGLLLAARDGQNALANLGLFSQTGLASEPHLLHKSFRANIPKIFAPLQLCQKPGHCQSGGASAGSRFMHGVVVSAAVVEEKRVGALFRYRVHVKFDATILLGEPVDLEKPPDWNEEEDGKWEPPDDFTSTGKATCKARYFQFTARSGRHSPLNIWPAAVMCALSRAVPIAHDDFIIELPEQLNSIIGGAVLGNPDLDVKLPSLLVSPEAEPPSWAEQSRHVGVVRLPEGKWDLAENSRVR